MPEVSFLRLVFLTVSQICCTEVRKTPGVWMQTNCDDGYLVVSKDKLGIDLMDNVFCLSFLILGRTVVKVRYAKVHEVLCYIHGA